VHLTPQAQSADVYIGGKLVQTDLAYKNISCYADTGAGLNDFKLLPAGLECPALVNCRISLYNNQHVTVAAMGEGSSDMHCMMYCDDLETDACLAKVRIIHASPDAPSLDVKLTRIFPDGRCPSTQSAAEEPEYKNLCFHDGSNYETFEPGNYEFQAFISRSNSTALKVPKIVLCPDVNYTIFIIGETRDNSLAAMAVIDAQQESR
jgi:hypothetical protein